MLTLDATRYGHAHFNKATFSQSDNNESSPPPVIKRKSLPHTSKPSTSPQHSLPDVTGGHAMSAASFAGSQNNMSTLVTVDEV